jgi:hypothetical protein
VYGNQQLAPQNDDPPSQIPFAISPHSTAFRESQATDNRKHTLFAGNYANFLISEYDFADELGVVAGEMSRK